MGEQGAQAQAARCEEALVCSFDAIDRGALGLVGGKGANLGELTRAGFPVPTGFCVTTRAFARFMDDALAAGVDVYALLDALDLDASHELDALRETGALVRDALGEVPLPVAVAEAVRVAWAADGGEGEGGEPIAYAVRSSATAEDLPHASFAGQQDTYLNICGIDALLAHVKDCFISLFTDRAILYRAQNRFAHRLVALSVVVQRMVQPEVSGILFTAEPVTGHRGVMSIDASFGLGEALVSGLVSADLYQVTRRTRTIRARKIAEKQLAIRSLPGGGTETITLTGADRTRPALTDAQVLALADLGAAIEAHYGTPQDIEWAIAQGTLYITQSRPITSLYPIPGAADSNAAGAAAGALVAAGQAGGEEALQVFFSFSHFQMMTDPMPPLVTSLWRVLFPVGHAGGQLESPHLQEAAGRLYVNLAPALRHPVGRLLVRRVLTMADELGALALTEIGRREAFQRSGPRANPLRVLARVLPRVFPYLRQGVRALLGGAPPDFAFERQRAIDAYVARFAAEVDAAPTLRGRLEVVLGQLRDVFPFVATWFPQAGLAMVAKRGLDALVGPAHRAELEALNRGLEGNVTTEMGLAVGDLADTARATPELAALLQREELSAVVRLERAAETPGGPAFLEAWRAFLARYGARSVSEIDLSRPRWSEDPSSLLPMIVAAMRSGEPGAHRAHFARLVAENHAAGEAVGAAASRGVLGGLRGPLVRRLVASTRALMPLREHHKFLVVRLLAIARQVFLEAGEALASEGLLERAGDVWFLSLPELHHAVTELEVGASAAFTESLRARVVARRAELERARGLHPPRVITSEGESPVVKRAVDAPPGALVGSPVSPGVVEGIAHVVIDPATTSLSPGEILVAPFTDPGWTPLFVSAAGLITEVGGLMTHGSVVAREYGIPAVVGVPDATTKIRTGQRLRVHGDAGYIEVLDASAEAAEDATRAVASQEAAG